MLQITRNMQSLHVELQSAHGILKDVIGTLDGLKSDSNLTKEVGIFIIQMPSYKILTKDSEELKKLLRLVCSGEITPEDAANKCRSALAEVEKCRDWLTIPQKYLHGI